MLRLLSCLLASILLLTSCGEETPKENLSQTDSEKLNQEGMAMIASARDSAAVYKGLYVLDKAIATDSNNVAAYNNKIGTLLQLNRIDKALQTIQLLNTKTNVPDYVFFEGLIQEKYNKDTIQAQQLYGRAISMYDDKIAEQPNESQIYINKGVAILVKDGQEAGMAYYYGLKPQFENDEFYKNNLKVFAEFDKAVFLEELW